MNSKLVKSKKAAERAQLTLDSFEEQTAMPKGIGLRGGAVHNTDEKADGRKTRRAGAVAMGVFAATTGTLFTVTGIIRNVGEFALLGTDIVIAGTATVLALILLFGEGISRKVDKVFHPVGEEKLDKLEKEIMEGRFSAAPTGKCNDNSK